MAYAPRCKYPRRRGRHAEAQVLGSFEHWAAVIGGALKVVGVEGEAWREFTLAWREAHRATDTHVSDLTELCEKQDLMLQTRGGGSARSQQSRLGRALQSARDRVFGDLQVVVVNQDRKKRTLYALKRLGATPPPPAPAAAAPAEDDDGDEVDPWQSAYCTQNLIHHRAPSPDRAPLHVEVGADPEALEVPLVRVPPVALLPGGLDEHAGPRERVDGASSGGLARVQELHH